MSLIARSGGAFTPAPEGLWPAVCVDVVDLGILKQTWQGKERSAHKCRLMWEISEKMDDGRRFIIGKRYTVSLHGKAQLFKDLKAWRGKPFTPDELAGFDLEKVVGAPCQLVITHQEKEDTVYANITAIMRANKATAITPSGEYVRMKDRQTESAAAVASSPVQTQDLTDFDPFDRPDEPHDDGDPYLDESESAF